MRREEKAQVIDSLKDSFAKCNLGILTGYRGITAGEMASLRKQLREANIEYRVVKNTLARLAAEGLGWKDVAKEFEGPVGVALGHGDAGEAARKLADYINTTKSVLTIRGAFLGERALSAQEVATLSSLPGKKVLIAQVLGGMQAPIASLVSCLSAPLAGLATVLQGRIRQLEGE